MNTIYKGIVTLIKSAVTQQELVLPADFSLEEAYPQIRRHSLIPLAYDGAARCGIARQEPVMQKLFAGYIRALQISEGQMKQVDRICGVFEENGIDYMPLKGCNMKKMYPAPELRTMGDADILIRMEQYEKIVPLMESLGFQAELESDHELIWKHPGLYLELHKRVIPSYNEDYYAYFGDGWKLARKGEGNRYHMDPEDEFIYEVTHFAKHFRDGGIGCRHVTDLWLLANRQDLDWNRIHTGLEKLQLLEFWNNIQNLIDLWFSDGEADETTAFLTEYIFASGNWGLAEEHFLSGVLRKERKNPAESSKLGYVLSSMFPDLNSLKRKYTVLNKAPWLLPAVWVYRPVYKILFERRDVTRKAENIKLVTDEKVEGKRAMLRSVGLDFNF